MQPAKQRRQNMTMTSLAKVATGAVFAAVIALSSASEAAPSQTGYAIFQKDQHSVTVSTPETGPIDFEMTFCILFSDTSPKLENRPLAGGIHYNAPSWHNPLLKQDDELIKRKDDSLSVGDGFDPGILKGSTKSRTADLFRAAPHVTLSATGCVETKTGYRFSFPEHPSFTLEATIELPDPSAPPVLSYRFTPRNNGHYSVGFMGAPAHPLDAVDEIWQPLIWQEKRFPTASFMELAYRCPVPTALVTHKGVTVGMVVDPEEFPFDALPVVENSRFGVAVRSASGLAQPMTFAPVLGLAGSQMKANQSFSFKLRPVLVKGGTTTACETIATSLYGFRDYRSNAIGSLNRTLENLVDYGMSDWSRFHVDEKGCSYATDAPGSVKNVSSLNPLGLAMITDDEQIFNQRAYPLIEYMLSRGKFLFTTDRNQTIQAPSYVLNGPCAPISELAVLYDVFGRMNSALIELAKREYEGGRKRNLDAMQPGKTWPNALVLYRMTGDQEYLDFAIKGADEYIQNRIATPQRDFKDTFGQSMFFWTDYNPRFAWLLELHEVTGEKRFLDAAHEGARRFTQQVWMSPRIPEKNIIVHPNGLAPHYSYLKGKGHQVMRAPKESVPAWRLSEIGLTPESSGTSTGHRAIFMANHAPWLIRIGKLTNDPFLRAVGRSAIVGRYTNFPGYHINTARTTVYEKPDYPLRPHEKLSVNSMHYNHIWPMASMVVDYLVSETMARSDGAIDFPSQSIEGYAYLQSKFYGTQKGRFYSASDATLWMPKNLLQIDSIEVNYIAARGENALYLALINESAVDVTAKITLNEKLVPKGAYPMRVSSNNGAFESKGTSDGALQLSIPARGLTAVVIDGCKITPRFQHKITGGAKEGAWKRGLVDFDDPAGRAMMLSLGETTKTAYIYLIDDATTYKEVSLVHDIGKIPVTLTDKAFPWEFTVPLDSSVSTMTFSVSALSADGRTHTGKPHQLSKK